MRWNEVNLDWRDMVNILHEKTMRQDSARRPGRTKHRRPWKRSRNALMRSAADLVSMQHNQLRVAGRKISDFEDFSIWKDWKKWFASHNFASKRLEATPYSRLQACFGLQVPKWLAASGNYPSSFLSKSMQDFCVMKEAFTVRLDSCWPTPELLCIPHGIQQFRDLHGFCRLVVRLLASSLHLTTPNMGVSINGGTRP